MSSGFPLDERQRAAVSHRGGPLVVVAGAGSGKTRVLTERIVSRVVDDGVPLECIAAITFTEKAAAEMKERLVRALTAAGRTTAVRDVERARISTVHAFCARLLRENAVAAGVDPAFAVLDQNAADALLESAARTVYEELDAEQPEAAQPNALGRLAWLLGGDPDETLLDVYRDARAADRGFAAFVTLRAGASPTELCDEIRRARGEVLDLMQRNDGKTLQTAATFTADPPRGDETVEELLAWLSDTSAVTPRGKKEGDVHRTVQALVAALNELAEHVLDERTRESRALLGRVLERLDAAYELQKGRGARLDFVDLEVRTRRLLEADPGVLQSLRDGVSDLLVDEFQDTNPLQATIVELVSGDGPRFVVGDPKQSIYGFRNADVSVFTRMTRSSGHVVRMDTSYRSRPEVVGFVNGLFAGGLSRGAPELELDSVPYEPLRAHRPRATGGTPRVEVFAAHAEKAYGAREQEAEWIAARIAALTGEDGVQVRGDEGDDGPTRAACHGDVAVLLRTMSNVKLIERALARRDIPYVVAKGRGFYETREVVDLSNLLACVANAADDLRLAAVLRSPMCGLDEESLFRLTSARTRGDDGDSDGEPSRGPLISALYAAVDGLPGAARLHDDDRGRAARFVRVFRGLRRRRGVRSLARLVDGAIEGTAFDTVVLAWPSGRQRLANLAKVYDMARACDAEGDVTLAEFASRLRRMRRREVRETEAAVAGDDAVRLMTVHQSKGLEFPVVFVPDAAGGGGGRGSSVMTDPVLGVGVRAALPPGLGTRITNAEPASLRLVKERRAAREAAESRRLLYVALTRASEHLVVSAAVSASFRGTKETWWSAVAEVVGAPRRLAAGAAEDERVVQVGESTTVLVHAMRGPRAPAAGGDSASGARDPAALPWIGRVAASLAGCRAPAPPSGPAAETARAAADALLAEAAREVPNPTGTLFESTVSAVMSFDRSPDEYRRRHLLGLPETLDLGVGLEAEDLDGTRRAFRAGDDDEVGTDLGTRALGRAVHLALERLAPEFTADVGTTVRDALRTESGGAPPSERDVRLLETWAGNVRDSELGRVLRRLPRPRVRREQSVLLRVGRTVLRGQIDLVYRDDDGWVIVDWKAGRRGPGGDPFGAKRAYGVQMALYALALQRLSPGTPVRACLYWLADNEVEECDVSRGRLEELENVLLRDFAAYHRAPIGTVPIDAT